MMTNVVQDATRAMAYNVHLTGLFLKVDSTTGKTIEIERIFIPEFDKKLDA